ncbi:MAG: hypothetical protein AAF657_11245, partial [Acidobacteriota bacterium]
MDRQFLGCPQLARTFWGLLSLVLIGPVAAEPVAAEPVANRSEGPEALWAKIAATELQPERAVEVRKLNFDTGMAVFEIEEGVFFPATPIGERSVEMVFQGKARLVLEPPNEVEAGQLELFTGKPHLEEAISEAAFVLTV